MSNLLDIAGRPRTGDRQSDIDVLLVAEEGTQNIPVVGVQRHGWLLRFLTRTGNQAQLIEHSRSAFAKLVRDKNRLVTAIREEGIALIPESAKLLRAVA